MRKTLGTLALAVAVGASGCGSGSGSSDESEGSPTSPSLLTPSETEDATPDFVGKVVDVAAAPSELAFGGGSVWVVSHRGAAVTRIDPQSGKVEATATSPGTDLVGIAVSAGHVWFLDSAKQKVEAVDMATNRLDVSVPVGSDGGAFAPASDGVWFAGTHGTVVHIGADGTLGEPVDVPRGKSGDPALTPWSVGEDVAVADATHGDVTVLDPATDAVVRSVHVGGDPGTIASDATDLWVGDWSGPLFRLDPTATKVVQTIKVPAVDHLVPCAGRLWVRVSDTSIMGVDAKTGKIVDHFRGLPVSEIPGGGLTCAGNALWVANWSYDTVWQIPL